MGSSLSTIAKKPRSSDTDLDPNNSKMDVSTTGLPALITKAMAKEMMVMQNELVLSTIAKKLPTRDIFSLRQTCTPWNRCLLPVLANQHMIGLHTDSKAVQGCHGGSPPGSLISKFTNSMKSATNIPFKWYRIHDLALGPQQNLQNFIQVAGKTITRLEVQFKLNDMKIDTVENLRRIIYEWMPELREFSISAYRSCGGQLPEVESLAMLKPIKKEIPKLRKFTLWTEDSDYGPIHDLMEDLFQCAVGLESISLQGYINLNTADTLQIISEDVHKFPAMSRLKSLTVHRLNARHLGLLCKLASLSQSPLRLLELETSIRCTEDQGASDSEMVSLVHQFLITQSESLRTFHINIDGMKDEDGTGKYFNYAVRLPAMKKLRSLGLKRTVKWEIGVQWFSANQFPALKHLEFASYCSRRGTHVRGAIIHQFAHEGVTSLKFQLGHDDDDKKYSPPHLTILPQTWPSVTKLELELNPSTWKKMDEFWTLWPRLISFRVRVWTVWNCSNSEFKLDELVSGVPTSNFAALKLELKRASKCGMDMERLRNLRTQFKTKPGISDLAQLQEFVVDVNQHKLNITDIGGYLGLAMMPSQAVQHVALLQHGGRNGVSGECRDFMRSIFGPYTVIDL